MSKEIKVIITTIIALSLIVIVLAFRLGSNSPDIRSRVPTMPEQIDQARQAAKDAKASADKAAQIDNDIKANIEKLNSQWRNSDGTLKIGHPEVGNAGTVTEVGQTNASDSQGNQIGTLWFTFAERGGFVKKFQPVCAGQSIPVNKSVILNYHWQAYNDGHIGCYVIDGYTVTQ